MIPERTDLAPIPLEPVVDDAAESGTRRREAMGGGERELGAIVADVWENAEKLVRQELELGLSEIDRRVDKLKVGLTTAVIGGAVLYAGILVLLAAVVLGLSTVMAPWLSALIVGGIVTGVGATMSQRGGAKAAESTKNDEHLQRTVGAMKEAVK
jgi:hypothetical protein